MKELNIDLDFDDLVVTQITCKTFKLFALANMASNFITGDSTWRGSRVGVIKIVIVINCNLITFFKVIACNCN